MRYKFKIKRKKRKRKHKQKGKGIWDITARGLGKFYSPWHKAYQ